MAGALLVVTACLAAVAAAAPLAARQQTLPENQTIIQYLQADERFTTLVMLLEETNLASKLNQTAGGGGSSSAAATNYTLFAPTNEAFKALNNQTVVAENYTVQNILEYHVLNYIFVSQNLSQLCFIGNDTSMNLCEERDQTNVSIALQTIYYEKELAGLPQRLDVFTNSSDTLQMVNNATIVEPDIKVANGYIHIVDGVLVPPANTSVVLEDGLDTLDTSQLPFLAEFLDVLKADEKNVTQLLDRTNSVLFAPWTNATATNATWGCILDAVRSKDNDTLTRQLLDLHIGQKVFYVSDLLYGNFSNTTNGQQTLPGFTPGGNLTMPLQRNTTISTLAGVPVNVTSYLQTGQTFVTTTFGGGFNVSIVNTTHLYDIPTRNGVIQFIDGLLVSQTFLTANNITC